jgi:O-antigen biosynthesis protein WbqP
VIFIYIFFKKLFDTLISFVSIIILLPLLIILVLVIKIESKGSFLFKQKRVGKNKKLFYIYKFRTMYSETPKDVPTHLLENPEAFITKTGSFLRKTSLDELPQLFNILFGQMSIVGPRPALWNQDDLISLRDDYMTNSLTPGLTGWAQINGRDELPIEIKAKLDGEYAKKISLFFDLKIIFLTITSVMFKVGIKEGRDV